MEQAVRDLVAHYRAHRRALPWHEVGNAYAIWVSEIMAQQTRLATVIAYWERWMSALPTVAALAAATPDRVAGLWSGLGYYSRARNLHRAASAIVHEHDGRMPETAAEWQTLPGVGPYTAAAIASIALGERVAVVDGNVERVVARLFAYTEPARSAAGRRQLALHAQSILDATELPPGDVNQAVMELGATLCAPTSPRCEACPMEQVCQARAKGLAADLPRLPARKGLADLPRLALAGLWIMRAGRVLLARRKPGGLFGGLWELPSGPRIQDAAEAIGVQIDTTRVVMTHEQALSHRLLTLTVQATDVQRLGKLPAQSPYDARQWLPLDAVASLGCALATRSVILRYKEAPWNLTPARLRSSPKATAKSSKALRSLATTPTTKTSATRRPARPKASMSSSKASDKPKRKSPRS